MKVDMIVYDPGDPSVGIFSSEWIIKDVEIEDKEHREEIRSAFNEAFETLSSGGHKIIFSDEQEGRITP